MDKKIIFVLFIFLSSRVFCQTSSLQSYMQRFSASDLSAKIEVLRGAINDRMMNEHIGEFYEYVLRYVHDYYAQMGELKLVNNLVNLSLNGLIDSGRSESLNILWRLFSVYPDNNTAAEILITMGILGKGSRTITGYINNYLMEKNADFRSGNSVDYTLVSACITAIMELDDISSYPVLFSSICAGYPEVISSEAYGALDEINGDLHKFLTGVIENNPPEEKLAAFKAGINSEYLALHERGRLAELVLEMTLKDEDDNIDMTAMRYASVIVLTNLRWTRASSAAVRHYYRVLADYRDDAAIRERFIEAIAFLGAVGDSQAALILCLQLGLINAGMERTGSYDADITLAIVQALGHIGDNAAFDHLMFVKNLPYHQTIKAAAQEAIERLKW